MTWMPLLAAAAAPGGENPFQAVARQFGWHPGLFVSQLVLFVMVAWVLKMFAYKPLLAMLETRRRQIQEGIENAERTRIELAKAQAKAQELIGEAGAQANKIIEEARNAAARVTELETQKAVSAAQDIMNKARLASEAELVRMKAELRREVGRLAVMAAMQVSGKVLTEADQVRLAEETNREIAA